MQTLGDVPTGCRRRLLGHYGPRAGRWLDAVPLLMVEAAASWKLSLRGYHDAGHASVVAVATASNGAPLILKAWYDQHRYRREITALRVWANGPTAEVIESADDLSMAALELIGGRAGGAGRPARDSLKVASAIQQVHSSGRLRPAPGLPTLTDFHRKVVAPRIMRRLECLPRGPMRILLDEACVDLHSRREDPDRTTLLHGDLYQDNVIFDALGNPRLIDPHPLVGDAVFDWAFWVVYYDLEREFADRLYVAAQSSGIPVPEILSWGKILVVDGFLYYTETDDPAKFRMATLLTSLMTADGTAGW